MSLLKTKLLFNASRQFTTSLVQNAYWNKDWKPAPYPKTKEERSAAAKKYGLLPEEYEPVPDDGEGTGDYPHLKPVSVEARDPFYPWDFPEYRRNFNEPLHEDFNIYTPDRINVDFKPKYSTFAMLAGFIGAVGGSYLLQTLGKDACFLPMAKQHLPEPGVKHYTYE
ncbi:NADH dehydrogenase [ubiquinone] 1 beta subcomplex subunit 8, mitochondrial [Halyomorpha halys]|uniref:NADH dehydrogenase [ubiquinone] 1 beta subcomplex subunit 8, mitochondrial n=1 Tax=Halyomorpha halys TaxID=286706 RepID=UPI0006D52126|nr:NADH dehydrogenase [ubiquinone] 1 beta subcomplex subunit 8, mitochondrial [Halyomorpha halys]